VIRIQGITRTVGNRRILDTITLDVPAGKILTLIGPSGSGKTSLLRVIDLLDVPTAGTILFDGTDMLGPNATRLAIRRRMAMVFQKPAVLNTTVAENVAFGLKFRKVGRSEIETRVREALIIVGLPHMGERRAVTLSGGEMQRVAIARAIVTRPEVLLLDEPTANLDPVNSELIENLVLRINREFHTTIILSTHDMIQGQRLGDRIGVIMDGRIAQVGDLHDIFYKPMGIDIARFVGIDTVLHGTVRKNDRGLAEIAIGETLFEAPTSLTAGKQVALYIRPEEITISPEVTPAPGISSVRNHFIGTIKKMVPFGPFIRVTVDCGFPITALITRRSCEELGLEPGGKVRASVKASAIHVLAENA
jgi:tungstate transport system ATP-binding protein